MEKVQRKSQGHRKKGDLHSPKGEVLGHSANDEHSSSSALHLGDLDSRAAPSQKSLGSPELDSSREWLASELLSRGVQKPVIFRARKGHGVEVKDGKRKLGQLENAELLARDTVAVDSLFRIRGCLKIELDPKEAAEHGWLLFALARAVVAGQRAAVLSLLRGDNGTVHSGTHAYRVLSAAVLDFLSKSKEERARGLTVCGDVMAMASKLAADKFGLWQRSNQADQSPPWFTSVSMPVKDSRYRLELQGRDLYVILGVQGAVERRIPGIRLRAYGRGPSSWTDIRRLSSGEYERGAARLVWDDNRRRWTLNVSYSRERPAVQSGVGAMVVCPGVDSFVRCYTEDAWKGPQDNTTSLVSFKLGLDARKASRGQHKDFQGSGARGHGRKRFTRLLRHFSDLESNFVKTHIEQAASRVARLALGQRLGKSGWQEMRGSVGEVLVADFGNFCPTHPDKRVEKILRRYPICGARDKICWSLAKAGVTHRLVKLTNVCPNCGKAKLKHFCGHDWVCPECHLVAPRDLWTGWQTFVAGGESQHYNLSDVSKAFRRAAEFANKTKRQADAIAEDSGSETQQVDQAAE